MLTLLYNNIHDKENIIQMIIISMDNLMPVEKVCPFLSWVIIITDSGRGQT